MEFTLDDDQQALADTAGQFLAQQAPSEFVREMVDWGAGPRAGQFLINGGKALLTKLNMAGEIIWESTYGLSWDRSFPESRSTPTIDRDRVYIMGGSSGAMMTQALLAVYPDIFKAGSARAGVPAGCWEDGYNSSNQWSSNCASGSTTCCQSIRGTRPKKPPPSMACRPSLRIWQRIEPTLME